jgi:hypothetical protein
MYRLSVGLLWRSRSKRGQAHAEAAKPLKRLAGYSKMMSRNHNAKSTRAPAPYLRSRLDAPKFPFVALVLPMCAFFLSAENFCRAAEPSLAILDAGVQKSEDAPFVSKQYRFYPGDYLYCRFQVAGYTAETSPQSEVRKISLSYEITPRDARGIALTPPVSDKIEEELNPEDKNWTPKRRASFLLPSFVAAGEFQLHIAVKDLLAKSEAAVDVPFRMGGVVVAPSDGITVENFHFFRKADDQAPLDVAAYSPGDEVYAHFDIAGYGVGPENKYRVSYGLTVYRPDGKIFLQQPDAAELSTGSFYAAQFVPGDISLTVPRESARGEYVIVLTAKDLMANRTYQLKRAFSIE